MCYFKSLQWLLLSTDTPCNYTFEIDPYSIQYEEYLVKATNIASIADSKICK